MNPIAASPQPLRAPTERPFGPELVAGIPVRNPDHLPYAEAPNPVATSQPVEHEASENDLDNVLLAVNKDVKTQPDQPKAKSKLPKLPAIPKVSVAAIKKPSAIEWSKVAPIVLAALASVVLAISAVYAFRSPPKTPSAGSWIATQQKLKESDPTQSTGVQMSPDAVEKFIEDMNSQVNGFSDEKNFSESLISTQALGI